MNQWHLEPNCPDSGHFLCLSEDIPVNEVKEFTFGDNPKSQFHMFIYNRDGRLLAYMNKCPHFSVPLNLEPGQFFTSDRSQFICCHHCARFNIDDGACTEGPCEGSSLEAIPLLQSDGKVYIGDVPKAP